MIQYETIYNDPFLLNISSCVDNTINSKNYCRFDKKVDVYQTDGSKNVSYYFNKQGYRSNLDYEKVIKSNEDYIVCLGCSHTEGVGVDFDNTWPEKLGRLLSKKVINLGLTGVGVDYCLHQYYLIQEFKKIHSNKPKYIFILKPPTNRFGIFTDSKLSFFQEWDFLNSKDWTMRNNLSYNYDSNSIQITSNDISSNIDNFRLNFAKNNYLINQIVDNDSTLYSLNWDDFGENWPLANDDIHFDETYHERISYEFFRKCT